jgi:hypothetical protein
MPIGNGSLSSLAQIVDEAKLEGARRSVRAVALRRQRSEVRIFSGAPIKSTRLRITKRRPRPAIEFEAYPQAEFYFECSESLLNGAGSPGDFH